jgi:hypothetical protein
MCHVTLANKAHLRPDHSALCFSLKCRIHWRLIKTVGLSGVHWGGIRFQIFGARTSETQAQLQSRDSMLHRNVSRTRFPARQTIA